jgi:hypothetical protein
MSERCIVRIKFTPADGESAVRKAVGGFLRYVQHRDLHPTSEPDRTKPAVSGLVKYVAYRDRAASRAELFSSHGSSGTQGRKEFVEFVARSIAQSEPQIFRTRDGRLQDRRRAVSRLILSPEQAQGLDLERLTRSAMERLATETGAPEMHWIAAIHRNTAHHHVHLVVAGMHLDATGRFHRIDIGKPRLAAIKEAVALEINRQRCERRPTTKLREPVGAGPGGTTSTSISALQVRIARPKLIRIPPLATSTARPNSGRGWPRRTTHPTSLVLRLQAVARRYQRQVEREAEEEARRRHWELVA